MKSLHYLSLIAAISVCISGAFAQSQGSIESSWKNTPKKKLIQQNEKANAARATKNDDRVYQAWEQQRSKESNPWPYLPKSPTPQNYYKANTLVIDSLESLYCLSSNYLKSLRARNDGAYKSSPSPPPAKEFVYTPPTGKHDAPIQESLSALHKELKSLLHNCVHGR